MSVPNLDTLNRLNPHECTSKTSIKPSVPVHIRTKPRRQTVHDHFHNSAQRVTSGVCVIHLFDHCLGRFGVETP